MTTLYGIANCDTIKKARNWLQEQNIDFEFHDFRKDGLEKQLLSNWVKQLGWETLLNKRGTTWRKLDDATKAAIDETTAIRLMLEYPTMIKRPVLVNGKTLAVGFSPERYQTLLT